MVNDWTIVWATFWTTLAGVWVARRFARWIGRPLPLEPCWVCGEACCERARVYEDATVVAEMYACDTHMPAVRDYLRAEYLGIHAHDGGESDE